MPFRLGPSTPDRTTCRSGFVSSSRGFGIGYAQALLSSRSLARDDTLDVAGRPLHEMCVECRRAAASPSPAGSSWGPGIRKAPRANTLGALEELSDAAPKEAPSAAEADRPDGPAGQRPARVTAD